MILSGIRKLIGVLKDELKPKGSKHGSYIDGKASEHAVRGNRASEIVIGDGDAIVIRHGKRNSLIQCWKCGKETWVLRGSKCYRVGLCGRCV